MSYWPTKYGIDIGQELNKYGVAKKIVITRIVATNMVALVRISLGKPNGSNWKKRSPLTVFVIKSLKGWNLQKMQITMMISIICWKK